MAEPLLRLRGIRRRFGPTLALDGVDLDGAAGQVIAIVGENGAGKSTLMRILAGAERLDAGTMELDGHRYAPREPADARKAGIALVHQELALAADLTVAENVLLGNEPRRGPLLDRKETSRRAADALAEVGRPDIPLDVAVRTLPPAAAQIVEIARAVSLGSRVVVLDEPTSSLGAKEAEGLFALVRRLRDAGRCVLYISHFLEEVRTLADRMVVLRDGRSVGDGPLPEWPDERIIAAMVGREVGDVSPASRRATGDAVLEVEGVRGNSLTLHRGEIVGIAGLVGSGRTEFLRAVFGLDAVRSGRVTVAGGSFRPEPARSWRRGVGFVSEDRKGEGLATELSIAENVALTRLPAILSPRRIAADAALHADAVGVKRGAMEAPVRTLSGGNQQKVALARLLRHGCDVLLLDEPTRGIDVAAKAAIYATLRRLADEGKAILFVSSYLPELFGVCDRIAVMAGGRLGPARPARERDAAEIMREAIGAAA